MPEMELSVRCQNLKCSRMFHVVPRDLAEVKLLNEILDKTHGRLVWLDIICPVCEHKSHRSSAVLYPCDCGMSIHPEELQKPTLPVL